MMLKFADAGGDWEICARRLQQSYCAVGYLEGAQPFSVALMFTAPL